MWRFLKAELEYYRMLLYSLAILFLAYTAFAITGTQLLEGPMFEIDYWGGLAGLFIYLVALVIWWMRNSEKRVRLVVLLPISSKQISAGWLLFTLIPMSSILIYLVLVHYIIIEQWHQETGSLLMQTGLFFIVAFTAQLIRNIWYFNANKSNLLNILISVIVLIVLAAIIGWIFAQGRLLFYAWVGWDYGRTMFYFVSLIPAFGMYWMFTKRQSFLH